MSDVSPKLIFSEDLPEEIFKKCSQTRFELKIYSAFIKCATLLRLEGFIDTSTKVTVVARWKLEDILAGVSDLSVYEYCKNRGWKFGIKLDLHSKVIVFDNREVLLGSSNITDSGLGIAVNSNEELNTIIRPEIKDINRLKKLEIDVTWLDDQLFDKISNVVELIGKKPKASHQANWPDEILQRFGGQKIKSLWISDLPQRGYEEYLELLVAGKVDRVEFKESLVFRWLMQSLNDASSEYTNFGWLTKNLHDVLIDEPRPYRKKVKDYVALIFDWLQNTDVEEIEIIQHSRTKSIHLK